MAESPPTSRSAIWTLVIHRGQMGATSRLSWNGGGCQLWDATVHTERENMDGVVLQRAHRKEERMVGLEEKIALLSWVEVGVACIVLKPTGNRAGQETASCADRTGVAHELGRNFGLRHGHGWRHIPCSTCMRRKVRVDTLPTHEVVKDHKLERPRMFVWAPEVVRPHHDLI